MNDRVNVRTLAMPVLIGFALCLTTAAHADAQSPTQVSSDDFAALEWLEGRWVGSGSGVDTFYESYRFTDEGTIEQTTWTDSTFRTQDARSTIEYRGGYVMKSRDGRVEAVVTDLDGEGVRFEFVEGGQPGYRWTRVSDDEWLAVLDRKGQAPLVYNMRRVSEGN